MSKRPTDRPVDERSERIDEAYEWLDAELCIEIATGEREGEFYDRLHLIGDELQRLAKIEEAAREAESLLRQFYKKHITVYGESFDRSDRPKAVAIVRRRLRTALDADRGGQGDAD